MAAVGSAATVTGRTAATTSPVWAADNPEDASSARAELLAYFASTARQLLREPMGVLRFPSVSPSLPRATYSTSLWDWDTLWTVRGLLRVAELGADPNLKRDVLHHARGSLANFFSHQSPEGRIPMLLTVTDPDPLGCLRGTRPHRENQAKPVLAQLALLVAESGGDAEWFRPHMPALDRFYHSWTADNLSACGLLVWGDDVAIGNDNDPTTFGRPYFSSANLLLNCLYLQDLRAAGKLARMLKLPVSEEHYSQAAEAIVTAIQQHGWDPRDRFFYTADVQCVDRRAELITGIRPGMGMGWNTLPLRVQTFTGFLPLWCGVATPAQAAHLRQHACNPATFAGRGGIRTLSASETMYSLATSSNPSNWLGPVWIISNYLVWSGLRQYGFQQDATQLAVSTLEMLRDDLRISGSLNEYYHPDTREPLSHQGFLDWNLLALEME